MGQMEKGVADFAAVPTSEQFEVIARLMALRFSSYIC